MKTAPPLVLKNDYFTPLQAAVEKVFNETLYDGLFDVSARAVENAVRNPLEQALYDGRIFFENGRFFGEFSARIVKRLREIGATYTGRPRAWRLVNAPLPAELLNAAADASRRFEAISALITRFLDNVDTAYTVARADFRPEFKKSLGLMDEQLQRTVRSIAILPPITDRQKDIIAAEWSHNIKLYIQKWEDEEIVKLREKVLANVLVSRRAESLVGIIQASHGSSIKKARFLARQETSLLMSKLRETRYTEMGSLKYRWSTSHDERVRPFHKDLEDHICEWANPPIIDKNGNRANPGEDFNCRCVAIPIFEGE